MEALIKKYSTPDDKGEEFRKSLNLWYNCIHGTIGDESTVTIVIKKK